MGAKLRRQESILAISGMAVMAFGVWDLVTGLTALFFSRSASVDAALDGYSTLVVLLTKVIFIIFEVISLSLRTYIGLSARSFGRGKDKGVVFLVLTGILLLINIASIIYVLKNINNNFQSIYSAATSCFINVTSVSALICLIISGIRVKVLRK